MFGLRSLSDNRRKRNHAMRRASGKVWLKVERKTMLGKRILWILPEDEMAGDVVLNEKDYRTKKAHQPHEPTVLAPTGPQTHS